MYVEAFTNMTPEARRRGHRPADDLRLCYAAFRGDLAHLPLREAAERLFGDLNRDDRPGARAFPSLSVGDLVSLRPLDTGQAGDLSLAVDPVDTRSVPARWASPHEHNGLAAALDKPPTVRLLLVSGSLTVLSKPGGVAVEIADVDAGAHDTVRTRTVAADALAE